MSEEQSYFLTDPPRLQGERKLLFTVVLTFAVLGIMLWGLQLRNAITSPYALSTAAPLTLRQELVDNNQDFLKHIDTTGNGISDYDKIYVYGTSRYLYDTYGYGMGDGAVISKGLPLCPGAGKNCGGIYSAEGGATVASSTVVFNQENAVLQQENLQDLAGPDVLSRILNDPKRLRELLVQTGRVSAQDLKGISDADLVKTAQILFASTTEQVTPSTSSFR